MTQQASSATSSVNKTAQQHVRESAAALADDTVLNDPEGYMKGLLLPTLNHVVCVLFASTRSRQLTAASPCP